MKGVWVVYYNDWHHLVRAVFDDELAARRKAADYGDEVQWLPFGNDWDHAVRDRLEP